MEVCVYALCGESTTDLAKEFETMWCSTFNLEISRHNCSVDIYLGVKLTRQLFISMLCCLLYYWVLMIKMSTVKWLLYSGGIMRNLWLKNHNQSSVFSIAVFKLLNKVAAGCHFAYSRLIDYLMTGNRRSRHILLNSSNNHWLKRNRYWERGSQALSRWRPKAISDVLVPPCGRSYVVGSGCLSEKRAHFYTLISSLSVFLWLLLGALKVTNCKKMSKTGILRRQHLFFSSLGSRRMGKLQHVFAQMPTGFCLFIYQTLQSTRSHEAGLLYHVWKAAFRLEDNT